ncbi:MAG: sigma-54-dependent Fis family transcriptional regulator [Bacteroidetes bacterium]|nr:sigma-54-dependent Fis family transcriptional regulator [Bacteroidota bacterium]
MLLGDSVQIKEINEIIKQVAPTDVTVLITGESGTGKEVVAKEIHKASKRKDKPYIIVNCGAIPEGIIESELFGHKKGSFTGAIDDRKGYFETADKGTIFLDEIGEMPLGTQVKLLRVLETGEFLPVGGSKPIFVDVRVIAATNRDLAQEVSSKNFREDLFYRLRSINIFIPPLRERKSDIKILLDYFTKTYSEKNNIQFNGFTEEAWDYINNFPWQGNARELRNFSESILVLYPNKTITLDEVRKQLQAYNINGNDNLPMILNVPPKRNENEFLFRALLEIKSDLIDIKNELRKREIEEIKSEIREDDFVIPKDKAMGMTLDEVEKEVLEYLLKNNSWNIEKVSSILNQSQRNIYNKIKKYKIEKVYN